MNICICIQSYKYFDISCGFLRDLHLRFGYWGEAVCVFWFMGAWLPPRPASGFGFMGIFFGPWDSFRWVLSFCILFGLWDHIMFPNEDQLCPES